MRVAVEADNASGELNRNSLWLCRLYNHSQIVLGLQKSLVHIGFIYKFKQTPPINNPISKLCLHIKWKLFKLN